MTDTKITALTELTALTATGLSIKQCNDILNKKANSGQLIKVSVCGKPGDPKFVYRKPPDL